MEEKNIFSLQCPVCSRKWESVEEFISDPETKVVGYQVNFDNLKLGFLLFHVHYEGFLWRHQAVFLSRLLALALVSSN